MKKLIKAVVVTSAIAAGFAMTSAHAQQVTYDWLRSVQLNPMVMPPILADKGHSFYVVNNLGVKQVFVVATPAVCVDSRVKTGVMNCVAELSDVTLHDNAPVFNNDHYVGAAIMAPDVGLHYTQTYDNTAMNVTEVKTLSRLQGY